MGEQINTEEPTDQPTDGTGGAVPGGVSRAKGRRYRSHREVARTRAVKVRVTDEEFAVLDAAAARVGGLSVGSWLGEVASDAARERPLISGEQYGAVRELTRQARMLGVNLNQIAAKLNSGGAVQGAELEGLLGAVDALCGRCSGVLDQMAAAMRESGPTAGEGGRG